MATIFTREPHITRVPQTARELRDDLSVKLQMACMRYSETGVIEEPMRVFHEAIEIAIRETIKATKMREITPDERKESPTWCDTVDVMRDAVHSAAEKWMLGL